MADVADKIVVAIDALTNQVARVASTLESLVLFNLNASQHIHLSTSKTCGYRLLGSPNTTMTPGMRCPACLAERSDA